MDGSDGGTSGGDPGDGNVCTIEPAPQGPALLDHANCIHQDTGIVLASCSSTNILFRGCDAAFLDWCNAQGGDAIACEEDELRSTSSNCGAGSPFVPCDVWFTDACDSADGVFVCNLYDEGGACVGGGCEQLPVRACSVSMPCANGLKIQCSVEDSPGKKGEYCSSWVNDGKALVVCAAFVDGTWESSTSSCTSSSEDTGEPPAP